MLQIAAMPHIHVTFFAILIPLILNLLGVGLLLLLIAGALAPFESLGWWAGWFGKPPQQDIMAAASEEVADKQVAAEAERYLVYLSGIGVIAGNAVEPIEIGFLNALRARIPDAVLVDDVFPYAMNNRGLTGQRLFSRMWQWIRKLRLENKGGLLAALVNARNVFQVAVSADRRYGPIYNYGISEVIVQHLQQRGYRIGSRKRVTLIGYSGGGQISIGAAAYLQSSLGGAPLQIISVGGVMSDDPGLASIEHLFHFFGSKDPVQKIGAIAYAGRWPLLRYSPWNQAKADGKITMFPLGPIGHTGPGGYFDPKSHLKDGQSFLGRTVDIVTQAIEHPDDYVLPTLEQQAPAQAPTTKE